MLARDIPGTSPTVALLPLYRSYLRRAGPGSGQQRRRGCARISTKVRPSGARWVGLRNEPLTTTPLPLANQACGPGREPVVGRARGAVVALRLGESAVDGVE